MNKICVLISIISLIIGFCLCVIINYYGLIAGSFVSFTIADLLKIITTIFMGSVVICFINKQNLKSSRLLDYVLLAFDRIEERLDAVYFDGKEHMENPNKSNESLILLKYKSLSMSIDILELFLEQEILDRLAFNDFKVKHFEMKEFLTGGSFGKSKANYNEKQKMDFEARYELMKKYIITSRIKMLV